MTRVQGWIGIVCLAVCSLMAGTALAASTSLGGFQHTAYGSESGAPTGILEITQDDDGFLWLASSKGLVRFDGVSFQPYGTRPGQAYPNALIAGVVPAEGGGMWLDCDCVGPVLAKDGYLTVFGAESGYVGSYNHIYRTPDGHVRSLSGSGVLEFRDGRWRRLSSFLAVQGVFDADGNEWLGFDKAMWVRAKGGTEYVGIQGLAPDAHRLFPGRGSLFFVRSRADVRIYRRDGVKLTEITQPLPIDTLRVLETRDGSIWLAGGNHVAYISRASLARAIADHSTPFMEVFSTTDGLSGSYAFGLYEDNSGNVWVGTSAGLDRFHPTAFTRVKLPEDAHEVSAATDASGNTWVGTEQTPLLKGHPPAPWTEIGTAHLTLSIGLDRVRNIVWAMNPQGLWRLSGDDAKVVSAPPFTYWSGQYNNLMIGPSGDVVVAPPRRPEGVLVPKRWDGQQWHDLPAIPGTVNTGMFDNQGVLWLALRKTPTLLRLDGDAYRTIEVPEPTVIGQVLSLSADGKGFWLGSTTDLRYFDGSRFRALETSPVHVAAMATGTVIDQEGYLWVQTPDGVFRSRERHLAASLASRTTPAVFDGFGPLDGTPGPADIGLTAPTLRLGGDGRIWAHSLSGLSWIDPAAIPATIAPPRPRIDNVTLQGRTSPLFDTTIRLAPDERDVRIGYASPVLARADLVRYAYRLRGLDDAWQDAGNRREATFTRLPAGEYVFDVRAVNGKGQASAVASIAVVRAPAIYETWWFRALLVLPVLLIVWLVSKARSQAATRKLRIRAAEREAVARDIHDTLLQRIQGLALTMQAWAADKGIPEEKRDEMKDMSAQARAFIEEGRDRLLTLRQSPGHGLTLYTCVMDEGRHLAGQHGMGFSIRVGETVRSLRPHVETALCDVAREAVRNAFQHSDGTHVEVKLAFEAEAFWITVTDDGKGWDAATVPAGHFGLVGMRERVEALRGVLTIDGAPGGGTSVYVRIPAGKAYGRHGMQVPPG